LAFRVLGTGTLPLFSLLDGGEADGESDGCSTTKESWMMMEGTPSATNDGGEEACKTAASAVAIAALDIAAPAFSSSTTGSSDTADKTKPEPFVEREMFDHLCHAFIHLRKMLTDGRS
jgi:hypothetical protein